MYQKFQRCRCVKLFMHTKFWLISKLGFKLWCIVSGIPISSFMLKKACKKTFQVVVVLDLFQAAMVSKSRWRSGVLAHARTHHSIYSPNYHLIKDINDSVIKNIVPLLDYVHCFSFIQSSLMNFCTKLGGLIHLN